MNAPAEPAQDSSKMRSMKHPDSARFEQLLAAETLRDMLGDEEAAAALGGDDDVMLWSTERVRKWLVQVGLEDLYGERSDFAFESIMALKHTADQSVLVLLITRENFSLHLYCD